MGWIDDLDRRCNVDEGCAILSAYTRYAAGVLRLLDQGTCLV